MLARLRNAALALALDLEDTVFWVDADVVAMPKHTISALVGSGKDIVTTITKKCARARARAAGMRIDRAGAARACGRDGSVRTGRGRAGARTAEMGSIARGQE